MKLKYYLRGLGIGLAVTALILGITSGNTSDNRMTDEEILSRAKELGLVERTVLSEIPEQNEEKKADVSDESESPDVLANEEPPETMQQPSEPETSESQPEESSEETESTEPEPLESSEAESTAEESKEQVLNETETEQPSNEKQTVSVEIVRGDNSVSVSRKLKEAGLIEDDLLYDRFLCENGYDKRILAKVYEIPIDATESEIAEMISRRAGTQ